MLYMPHKDLKWFLFLFITARQKRILKIGFHAIAVYLFLFAHPKFNLENWLLVQIEDICGLLYGRKMIN